MAKVQQRHDSMLTIFQISTLLLVSVTAVILAGAEEFPLPAATIPVAIATWWIVDRMGIVLVPVWLAPILALAAIGLAVFEYEYDRQQSMLAVCGHMLTYLIWIFLLQQKSGRQYWWLFALCLLQVAVAAMLTYSIWFGFGLLLYAFLSIWCLSVFLLYNSTASLKRKAESVEEAPDPYQDSPSVTSEMGEIWNSVALGPQTRLMTGRFIGNTFFIFVQTFLIGAVFFLLIPRIWANAVTASAADRNAHRPLTGFTDQVRLGDLGEILQDSKEVLTIQVFRNPSNEQVVGAELIKLLGTDPLFRGAVLENYQDGAWTHDSSKPIHRVAGETSEAPFRLQFDLKPVGVDTVFSYGNMITARAENRAFWLQMNDYSQELRRSSNAPVNDRFVYNQFTDTSPPDTEFYKIRQQVSSRLAEDKNLPLLVHQYSPTEQDSYLRALTVVPERCSSLKSIATRVAWPAKSPEVIARRIEEWFTTSGEFNYTTKLTVTNSSIDPIVDFMVNRKKGHCEYYASAMAMLLRTQGIPSRVITGFKGGTLASNRKVFRIQQLHAHAWVEAYLDGHWITFDPTPAERNEEVSTIEGRRSIWRGVWLGAETAWSKMAGMTQEVQQARIYGPLIGVGKTLSTSALRFRDQGLKMFQHARAIVLSPARWFSWEGGVLAAIVMLIGSLLFWLFRRIWKVVSVWSGIAEEELDSHGRKRRLVPFYERFLAILKSEGLEQRSTQTAQEFVEMIWPQLRPRLAVLGAADWSDEIVKAFYHVRFGGADLDSINIPRLEELLGQLERSLLQENQEPL